MATKLDLLNLLHEIYNLDGPREVVGNKTPVVAASRFAKMTDKEADRWDFYRRDLMRKVARAIASRR